MLKQALRLSAYAIIAATVIMTAACPNSGAKVGLPAPALKLDRLGGGSVNLSELKGKVVLVNFWATWCDPCREEMPDLEKLHRHFEGRPFMLVAASIDDEKKAVEQFAAEHNLSLPILLDPGAITSHAWGTAMFPESYIIDAQGNVAAKYIGMINYEKALAQLEKLVPPKQ